MDWNKIYNKELFQAQNCYLECGGYCCNNFFGKYYSILDKDSVILPMLDEEYVEYKKRGSIKNINEQRYELKILDKKLIFYLLACKEKGLCNPHSNRPFICKIYPYIPKVNYNGDIIGFNYASLMDIFYSNSSKHNCPLVRTKERDIQSSILLNIGKLSPKMIYAFILIDKAIENIKNYFLLNIDELEEKEQKKFVAKFEMLMLSGKAFKDIRYEEIYLDLVKIHGEFL